MTTVPASTNQKKSDDLKILQYISLNIEDYTRLRAAKKIKGYSTAGQRQKHWYHLTSTVALIGSATVPVLINLSKTTIFGLDSMIVTTVISLLVTILVSIEKLYGFREHWRSYDRVAAALHYEQLMFQSRSGFYAQKKATDQQLYSQFVQRFEGLILDEKNLRIAMETNQPGENAQKTG